MTNTYRSPQTAGADHEAWFGHDIQMGGVHDLVGCASLLAGRIGSALMARRDLPSERLGGLGFSSFCRRPEGTSKICVHQHSDNDVSWEG